MEVKSTNNVAPVVQQAQQPAKKAANLVSQTQITHVPDTGLGRDLISPTKILKAGDINLAETYGFETKPQKATFTLANGTESFPNVWDKKGGMYTPAKGDIILGYGEVPTEWGIQHPGVLKEMEEKGLSAYPDRAVSSEVDIMYETYKGVDGRDFKKNPLKPGETVASEKIILPSKVMFVEPGTKVETLEAKLGTQKMPTVADFQYVQLDKNGNPYVKDIQDIPKRLKATNEEATGLLDKVKSAITERKAINSKYFDIIDEKSVAKFEGAEKAAESEIHALWKKVLPTLKKVVK